MLFIIKKIFNSLFLIFQFSPIALVWVAKAFLFDFVMSKISFKKLPDIAKQMGLIYKQSSYLKKFGKLEGNINKHFVTVAPDNSMNSYIRVSYKKRYKGLEFSLSRPTLRLEKNVHDFKTFNWKFNLIFKTLRASEQHLKKIKDNVELLSLLYQFYSKWIFHINTLVISDSDVYCSFNYGFYFFPYIPASKLKNLIEEITGIAEEIDVVLG